MTSPDVTVRLVRHGETEWSADGRHTSRTDLPLTAVGERQARSLADRLAGLEFTQVLVSPRQRARRTAELAGVGDRIEIDDDLVEWDYGDYEGLSTAQIRTTVPGWTVFTAACPGGESISQVAARADRVIARVRRRGGSILLVAHGHLLRVLAARWLGLDPAMGAHLELDVATVSRLGWERTTATIEVWNG